MRANSRTSLFIGTLDKIREISAIFVMFTSYGGGNKFAYPSNIKQKPSEVKYFVLACLQSKLALHYLFTDSNIYIDFQTPKSRFFPLSSKTSKVVEAIPLFLYVEAYKKISKLIVN